MEKNDHGSATAPLIPAGTVCYTRSAYNDLYVVERDGFRYLTSCVNGNHHIQSQIDLAAPAMPVLPYVRAMPAALSWATGRRRILIGGLGLGSLPSFLADRIPDAVITCVEIDEGVASLYRRYGAGKRNVDVVIGDIFSYASSDSAPRYDVIFLDAYLHGCLQGTSHDSLQVLHLADVVRGDGSICINFDRKSSLQEAPWLELIKRFTSRTCYDVGGNILCILSNNPEPDSNLLNLLPNPDDFFTLPRWQLEETSDDAR